MKRIIVFFCTLMCVASVCAHTINWKIDNQTYQTTTCNSGDNVTPPSAPSKTGYTFVRWAPLYNFSTLDTTITCDHRYSRDFKTANNSDVCRYDGVGVTCDSDFDDLGRHQWKASFSYGTIYGDAMCSTTAGTNAVAGNPLNGGGQYCWCRATGYLNDDILYAPVSHLPWVFNSNRGGGCTTECAYYCAAYMPSADFRQALFGVTQ